MEKKLAYRVKDLVAGGVGSRSTVYEAIAAKKLKAHKRGRSTIILPDDLENYLQNLPNFLDETAA